MKTFSQFLSVLVLFAGMQSAAGQTVSQALNKRLETLKTQSDKERVFLISDRDLYSPGENIWLTAMVYDILSPSLSNLSSSVFVRVYNSDQSEVLSKKFPVINGIATGAMTLPADIPDDIYYLKGETSLSGVPGLYFKKIIINQKPIPQFIIEASIPDQLFKPTEQIPMTITFKDYYNEPISSINYLVEFFDGAKKISEISGKIKKELNAEVKFTVPQTLASGLLHYRITGSQKSREAILTGQLKTVSEKIFVEFYPESGKLVDNIQTKVRFYVYDAAGQPVSASGSLIAMGVKLNPISSNSNGLGAVSLTPNANTEYKLQLELPGTGVVEFPMPAVQEKGMTLQFGASSGNLVSGHIKSNYPTQTAVILIAESNGNIIHLSEQTIGAEFPIAIDVSKAGNSMIHLVLLSATADILAEQLVFGGDLNHTKKLEPATINKAVRGKMAYELAGPIGATAMSAVNQPWIMSILTNYQPWLLAYPYDFVQQSMYQTESFLAGIIDDELLQEYLACYTPSLFSWDKVLNTQGSQVIYKQSKSVMSNKALLDKIKIHGNEIRTNDVVKQTNMNASSYFITSNPKFLTALYDQKTENIPSYVKMLQSGTQLLEVIQTIKPYRLEGSNIVFVGGSNSLMAQGGALIVIDGVNRGTDVAILRNISSFDVSKINVSTNPVDIQRYTGLNSVGLIEIWLKKGELPDNTQAKAQNGEDVFIPVDYEQSKSQNADYRSTLHWNCSSMGTNDKWQQQYFNSDLLSSVFVQIYLIPTTGVPVLFQDYYQVDPK